MRCKKHVTDLSSAIGVCASCLRERLFVLIAAQAQEDRRKSDSNPPPPPLVFPRSVSPYISRRKSDTTVSSWTDTQHQLLHPHSLPDQRFYSTPQVGPSGSLAVSASASYFKQQNKKNGRFSLFANLFRSKSDKLESEISGPSQIVANSRARDSCTAAASSSSSSPSWFSAILSGRGKKQNRTFSVDESAAIGGGHRRVCRNHPDRGMSPNRYPEEEDEHYHNGSSGYSSESSQPWKQTPRRTPAWMGPGRRLGGGKSGQCRNVSGMGFCLSPLVRASPSSHWNQKGIPPEMVVSGEMRVVPVKPHLSNAASFCKNRSRKLADFGRFHQNR